MRQQALATMQQETLRHMNDYRKLCTWVQQRGLDPEERAACEDWIRAIESVRILLHRRFPERERAMVRLFGLDHPVPRCSNNRARMLQLSADLCVSEPTLYKWRSDMIHLVLLAAIELGLLAPFGFKD